jgi:glycosyltransferase involved in cell wall biosynthesis
LVDVLRDMRVDQRKLHVLRNGVDLDRFKRVDTHDLRARMGLSAGHGPLLLSVGHLIERKGHHLVIEALAALLPQHPEARLVIVGEGVERARLEALAQQLGVADRVTLTGSLPQTELPHWYSAADVLVLASSREGWANVLLEAMACGTPVVATNIWGTPEVVVSAEAGVLVDERSGVALANGVRRLMSDRPDPATVRRYAEAFSWDATSRAQLALFQRLASCAPVRPARMPQAPASDA